jgi:hypothetical protein
MPIRKRVTTRRVVQKVMEVEFKEKRDFTIFLISITPG